MGKAMALEKMMKKMPARGFHTSAYRGGDVSKVFDDVKGVLDESLVKKVNAVYAFKVEGHFHSNAFKGVRDYSTGSSSVYENVPQVFERIETICNEEIVKQVGSTFLFDIDGVGKYYLDFKNGAGKVVQSEPDTKPDVTIIMNEQIALKIFNRELKAAAAFMTGQIKARGDLAKAFALEKVLAAARDARLKEEQSQE